MRCRPTAAFRWLGARQREFTTDPVELLTSASIRKTTTSPQRLVISYGQNLPTAGESIELRVDQSQFASKTEFWSALTQLLNAARVRKDNIRPPKVMSPPQVYEDDVYEAGVYD